MVSDAVDPRRVRRFYQPEQQPPDYLSVLSLGFGVVGLMFKQTLFSWLSVFCCLSSVANVKVSALDVKQITCSIMFALMGLFMNYFGAATLKTKGAAMAMPADGPGSPPIFASIRRETPPQVAKIGTGVAFGRALAISDESELTRSFEAT